MQGLVAACAPERVGAADDDKVSIAARRDGLGDLGPHQFLRDHVLDADVMVGALGQELILNLDRTKPGCLAHADRAMHVHRIAPAAGAVEDQRQRADGADFETSLRHLGQREVCLGPAFDVAHRPAAQVEGSESRRLGELG